MKNPRIYSIPQELLYTISRAGWNLCSQFLIYFTTFSAAYTAVFIAARLQAVDDASDLPDIKMTKGKRTRARKALIKGTKVVMKDWQALKAYIQKAFPADEVDAMVESAGGSLYKQVGQFNWPATRSLITAAQKFLAEYSKELSANNLMPATFPVTFQADAVACIDLATAFAEADRIKEMAVGEKIKSNNALYLSLTGMLVDAKNIFKDDANTRKQFSVARLVAENSDKNAASLSGYVYNENNLPIEGAVIASKNGLYTATTNAKGRYTISRINSEEVMYTFAITCPGYQPITQDIDFKAGTGTRVSFTLASVMKKVA